MQQTKIKQKTRIKTSSFEPGTAKRKSAEEKLSEIKFTVHKFTCRPKPKNNKDIVIFPVFSEFGSETLIPLYCIPKLMQRRYCGKYSIVMGWHGRAYLYKHLVDEFWELNEEYQYLREYCRAFHHDSKNLKELAEQAAETGQVVSIGEVGNLAVYPALQECPALVNQLQCKGHILPGDQSQLCTKCGVSFPAPGLFSDVKKYKQRVVWPPPPAQEKLSLAAGYLKPRSVGIVGRGRKCYGRNLDADFYRRLIGLLESLGYSPIWLGEKATTIPCPCPHVLDFSRTEESRDLELTLALVSQLSFTIQFWTASTRLAGLVGTPFLLFESPDQVWGQGQEGFRLNLCSRGPKKIVAAQFINVLEDQDTALEIVKQAVSEMEKDNYQTIIGQVENVDEIQKLISNNDARVGFD